MSESNQTPFYLFSGDCFYPWGGWRDFSGSYPSHEAAKKAALNLHDDWWQIVWGEIILEEGGEK